MDETSVCVTNACLQVRVNTATCCSLVYYHNVCNSPPAAPPPASAVSQRPWDVSVSHGVGISSAFLNLDGQPPTHTQTSRSSFLDWMSGTQDLAVFFKSAPHSLTVTGTSHLTSPQPLPDKIRSSVQTAPGSYLPLFYIRKVITCYTVSQRPNQFPKA